MLSRATSHLHISLILILFFLNDPAPPEIYTLSLHDALPILGLAHQHFRPHPALRCGVARRARGNGGGCKGLARSEEHTSELQSRGHLVCRLLLEKKKTEPKEGGTTYNAHYPGRQTSAHTHTR